MVEIGQHGTADQPCLIRYRGPHFAHIWGIVDSRSCSRVFDHGILLVWLWEPAVVCCCRSPCALLFVVGVCLEILSTQIQSSHSTTQSQLHHVHDFRPLPCISVRARGPAQRHGWATIRVYLSTPCVRGSIDFGAWSHGWSSSYLQSSDPRASTAACTAQNPEIHAVPALTE